MKTCCFTIMFLMALALSTTVTAQEPEIVSMANGKLTFTNVRSNYEYQVEWLPRISSSNSFRSSYDSLIHIPPTNMVFVSVEVPQYFRIKGQPALFNNVVRASDLQLVINATTNSRYSLEWSESADGPWYTTWSPEMEVTVTNGVMTIPSPRYYRITYLN
jgi:hypothetical protein